MRKQKFEVIVYGANYGHGCDPDEIIDALCQQDICDVEVTLLEEEDIEPKKREDMKLRATVYEDADIDYDPLWKKGEENDT